MKKNFEKMTKPEKAIAVARDVLLQLRKGKYTAATGTYINGAYELSSRFGREADVQSNINVMGKCEICAIGSCLLSATRFGNLLNFGDLEFNNVREENSKASLLLSKVFDKHQLMLVEYAFEGNWDGFRSFAGGAFSERLSKEEVDVCNEFYERHEDDNDRLREIFKNIIRNKGEFVI